MKELLERVAAASRGFERSYVEWMAANEMGEPAGVLSAGLSAEELTQLEEAAGAPLTEELRQLLESNGTRVSLGLGPDATAVLGFGFAWLDNESVLDETRKLREASEENGWELPPCVALSAENSEPVAYRLDTGTVVVVSAHDDGELTELDLGLGQLLTRYAEAAEKQVSLGYGA